jgi:zinc protease
VLPVYQDMVDIQQSTLSNGLRIAIQPDGSVPLVGVSLTYDVGSRVEEEGASGFAHLFEHLMFQGSAHVAPGEFVRHIQGSGGIVNGSTGVERTTYYHSAPAHQLALGLWLEADRMRSLAVTEETLERQRATVLDEYRERVEQRAYGRAHGRISEMSYQGFAYGHPVIGYRADIEAASLDAVCDFYQTWYRPDNAVLSITGDVDPEEALDIIYRFFSDIPRGDDRSVLAVDEPPRMLPQRAQMCDPQARLPAVFVNHPAVPYGDPDFYVYEVLETLLFRGASSRLRRQLVTERGAALSLKGGYEAHRGPSVFSLFAVLSEGGDTARLVDEYAAVLAQLSAETVGTNELERVLNQVQSNRVFAQEDVVNRANTLGRSVLVHSDVRFEERYLDRISRVTPGDIIRVARRDFDPNALVALEVSPG